ncbi:transmembrane protein [Rhynchospora pubera]|uniref:Transmembrane protein n=1 Tax=Rhynchospora pubera TaxID=906938 RepID=A0AAV8CI09_9POAL|nr:transmembrane protein [Rhynchospora pubera]
MEVDDNQILSSPTNSSPSSSDLDTESTGSFFPDRSTTLGTLMGVTLIPTPSHSIRPRAPPTSAIQQPTTPATHHRRRRRRRRGRSGWWRLCRDDTAGPTKLGEFLEVERRINNAAGVLIEAEFGFNGEAVSREEGRLFENGRVLPPSNGTMVERRKKAAEISALARFPVLITGICSGGER